jgi:putative endonuclease
MAAYFVYILKCADDTYYTGITNDLSRRLEAHNSSAKGAKYTRGRRPVHMVYQEKLKNKSKALHREAQIKALSRQEKILLMQK